MSVEGPNGGAPLSMAGLFVRLLACLVVGVPAGFAVYRWLHRAFEGLATVQETLVAALALGVLVLVMWAAARALARAP
jgi:hypothetical protein